MSKFAPPNQNVPMSGGRFVHVDHFYLFEADVNQKSDGANLDSTLTMLRPTTTLLKLLSDQTYDGGKFGYWRRANLDIFSIYFRKFTICGTTHYQ